MREDVVDHVGDGIVAAVDAHARTQRDQTQQRSERRNVAELAQRQVHPVAGVGHGGNVGHFCRRGGGGGTVADVAGDGGAAGHDEAVCGRELGGGRRLGGGVGAEDVFVQQRCLVDVVLSVAAGGGVDAEDAAGDARALGGVVQRGEVAAEDVRVCVGVLRGGDGIAQAVAVVCGQNHFAAARGNQTAVQGAPAGVGVFGVGVGRARDHGDVGWVDLPHIYSGPDQKMQAAKRASGRICGFANQYNSRVCFF